MDNNNNNPTPQPGSESLNERLRRAAEMARRNMAAENTPPTRPVEAPRQQPATPPRPAAPQRPSVETPKPAAPAPSPAYLPPQANPRNGPASKHPSLPRRRLPPPTCRLRPIPLTPHRDSNRPSNNRRNGFSNRSSKHGRRHHSSRPCRRISRHATILATKLPDGNNRPRCQSLRRTRRQ